MNASIYSMNNGAEIAYQYGNSRAIQGGSGWRCEILKAGEWVARSNRWAGIYHKVKAAVA